MSSVAEEDAYWVKQVEGLYHDALTNVRGAAGKWQAGLTAALGGFATLGFIWGPEKLDTYPIEQGFWRNLSLVLLVLAGVTGVCAMVFASLASIGIPSKYATMTGPDLEKWTQTRAGDALGQLKTAMFLAGVAGLLVVSLSTWILVASANKAPDPSTVHAIVIAKGGAQCGELVNTDKGLQLKIGDSVTPIGKDATVTVVTTCP